MAIDLVWSPSFTFEQLLEDDALRKEYDGKPGVYIHTDRRLGRVAYVGKSNSSLWNRNLEHYVHLIGGLYLIPELDVVEKYAWNPGDWKKRRPEILDRTKFHQVVDKAYDYAETVRLHFCVLDKSEDTKHAEDELLYALWPWDTKRGTMNPPKTPTVLVNRCQNFPEIREFLQKDRPNITFLME